jgi:TolB-like protein
VKILDFGLARVTRPTIEDAMSNNNTLIKTEKGIVMGTVGYMSPEQVRGEQVNEKSDVFSFGCVLYEMLSGKRAFMGETTAEIAAAILRDEPPKLTQSCKDIPVELGQVIGRCLKKDPEERYQSVRDLADALKAISSGSDIGAFVPLRKTRRLRLALSILIILLLLVPVTIYVRSRWSGNATNQPIDSLAVLPLVNASGEENLEYLSDGITESLINSLSRVSPNLRVIARSTVFRYKGREADPTKVGSELGVRAVVMGKVVLRGDMLNIQVDLVDAADGRQLWGEQFDKKRTDLLSVQEEIARRISSGLRLKLTVAEQERLTKRYTQNIEAYQLYMKGRFQLFKFSKEGMEKGIELLNEAILWILIMLLPMPGSLSTTWSINLPGNPEYSLRRRRLLPWS